MLGHNVHGGLGQIQVGADARRGRDAGGVKDLPDHGGHQLVGRHAVEREIVRQVDENLVDGIDVDVLGRHILEIDLVDAGAVLDVGRHAGRRNDVAQFQRQVFLQGGGVKAGGGKRPFSVRPAHGLVGADGIGQTLAVDLPDFLHHLKQPRAARNAAGFQAGRHRQADGLFAAGHIRHH